MELIILILLSMVTFLISINFVDKIQNYSITCIVKNNTNKQSTVDGRQATICRVDYIVD